MILKVKGSSPFNYPLMDFKFKKQINVNSRNKNNLNISTYTILQKTPILTFISYNFIKLTYLYDLLSRTTLSNKLHLYNGTLLVLYNEYVKVLRKSLLPWMCSLKLTSALNPQNYLLNLVNYSLRQKLILRKLGNCEAVFINYTWTSPFYRVRRVKRWLSKKYTNRLWR